MLFRMFDSSVVELHFAVVKNATKKIVFTNLAKRTRKGIQNGREGLRRFSNTIKLQKKTSMMWPSQNLLLFNGTTM